MVNRYEILAANSDGTPAPMLAFAEQKRMRLKERVDFFTDESRTRRVFSFEARQRLDVHAEHDVFDEDGRPLATSASSSAPACCGPPGTCTLPASTPSVGNAGPSPGCCGDSWEARGAGRTAGRRAVSPAAIARGVFLQEGGGQPVRLAKEGSSFAKSPQEVRKHSSTAVVRQRQTRRSMV
jgi:hypothetical protein